MSVREMKLWRDERPCLAIPQDGKHEWLHSRYALWADAVEFFMSREAGSFFTTKHTKNTKGVGALRRVSAKELYCIIETNTFRLITECCPPAFLYWLWRDARRVAVKPMAARLKINAKVPGSGTALVV